MAEIPFKLLRKVEALKGEAELVRDMRNFGNFLHRALDEPGVLYRERKIILDAPGPQAINKTTLRAFEPIPVDRGVVTLRSAIGRSNQHDHIAMQREVAFFDQPHPDVFGLATLVLATHDMHNGLTTPLGAVQDQRKFNAIVHVVNHIVQNAGLGPFTYDAPRYVHGRNEVIGALE